MADSVNVMNGKVADSVNVINVKLWQILLM